MIHQGSNFHPALLYRSTTNLPRSPCLLNLVRKPCGRPPSCKGLLRGLSSMEEKIPCKWGGGGWRHRPPLPGAGKREKTCRCADRRPCTTSPEGPFDTCCGLENGRNFGAMR